MNCVSISCDHFSGKPLLGEDALCPDCRAHEDRMLQANCDHEWAEAVDEEGQLIEPAHDICTSCGAI